MGKRCKVTVLKNASKRTKERFSRFSKENFSIELINRKINKMLTGDGFYIGHPMSHFGIDVEKDNLRKRVWEGWIPDNEIEVKEL